MEICTGVCCKWSASAEALTNYTDPSRCSSKLSGKAISSILQELLYLPVYWTGRERNANSSSGCLGVQMISDRFHY